MEENEASVKFESLGTLSQEAHCCSSCQCPPSLSTGCGPPSYSAGLCSGAFPAATLILFLPPKASQAPSLIWAVPLVCGESQLLRTQAAGEKKPLALAGTWRSRTAETQWWEGLPRSLWQEAVQAQP